MRAISVSLLFVQFATDFALSQLTISSLIEGVYRTFALISLGVAAKIMFMDHVPIAPTQQVVCAAANTQNFCMTRMVFVVLKDRRLARECVALGRACFFPRWG